MNNNNWFMVIVVAIASVLIYDKYFVPKEVAPAPPPAPVIQAPPPAESVFQPSVPVVDVPAVVNPVQAPQVSVPVVNQAQAEQVATNLPFEKYGKTCRITIIYNTPNLEDKAAPPYSLVPEGFTIPIAATHGDWTLLWEGMANKPLWILTQDLC